MTIDNCLETKIDKCEDTQTRQKEACRDSVDFKTIQGCFLGADEEFNRCKSQAKIDCETQDPKQDPTTKLQEPTPPPPTQNITNSTETPPPSLPPSSSPPSSSPQSSPSPSLQPPPSSLLPPSSSPPPLPSSSQGGSNQTNVGAIVGGVGGGLTFLVLCGIVFCLYKQYKKNKDAALPTTMERRRVDAKKSKNRAEEPSDTQFSVRSPAPPGVIELGRLRFRGDAVFGSAEAYEASSDDDQPGRGDVDCKPNKLVLEEFLKECGRKNLTTKEAAAKVRESQQTFSQQFTTPTKACEQQGPMVAAGGAAVDHGDELHQLGPDSPAIDNPVSEEYTGGNLTPEQAANAVLSQLKDDSGQEGAMGAAGGTAVVHASEEALGPDSPDDLGQQLRKDDDVIPDDVKECMEEIILTLEKDLKFEPQTMITPPPQPELSPSPNKRKDDIVQEEADDSPRAARNFWGKIDQAAKDKTSARLRFTPEKSPTNLKVEPVSPGKSGGLQV